MNLSFYIAWRYFFSKRKWTAINIISFIAFTGICVATAALMLILSVFSGLERLNMERFLNQNPDIKIIPKKGKYFKIDADKRRQLEGIPGVLSLEATIEEMVYISSQNNGSLSTLKGLEVHSKIKETLDSNMVVGRSFSTLKGDSASVFMGSDLAYEMGFSYLDPPYEILLSIPNIKNKNPYSITQQAFMQETANVVGCFSLVDDLDQSYLFTSIDFVRRFLSLPKDAVYSLSVKKNKGADESKIKQSIAHLLGPGFNIENKQEQNPLFFRMLNIEKLAIYILFSLILIIATFNLVGAIVVLFLDKEKDFKTYKSLGFTDVALSRVFLFVGMLITCFGGLLGIGLGLFIGFLQKRFGWVRVNPWLSYPVDIEWSNISIVAITALCIGGLTSLVVSKVLFFKQNTSQSFLARSLICLFLN